MAASTISSTDIQRHKVDEMSDTISNLPEGVLLHILSLLPTKDAVRTSVLANKWRNLWTYLSAFHFDTFEPDCEQNHQHQINTSNCLLDLVGSLLHKSNRVERLGIQIFKHAIDTDKLSSIISSAAKQKVQYFRLSLGDRSNKFVLPHSFSAFESLNELHLGLAFTLHIPSGIRFSSLKKLLVSDVTFADENSVQQLFSGCPVLEELDLFDCPWENIQQMNVAISTLKKLSIDFDDGSVDYDHDMTLTIDAVNLLSLSCTCKPAIEFILVNLTSLVDASIELGDETDTDLYAAQCAFELLSGLSSVKSLHLHNNTLGFLSHLKDTLHFLPTFHNLTHLDVFSRIPETTNEVLMDILRKTTNLEILEIPGVVLNYLDGEDLALNTMPCCFQSSLNQLCILSFHGREYEIQFVTLILKNAPCLGEINIHCSSRLFANDKKVNDIWNQLEDVALENCVIEFYSNYYDEFYDDESDEDEAANIGVLPAAGFIQEPSSVASISATSTGQSQLPDIEEMWQLWRSKYQQIFLEEVQQASTMIVERRVRMMMDEVLPQQMLIPPSSYYQQQMSPIQESSSSVSVSAASTGSFKQYDIEEIWQLWESKHMKIAEEERKQISQAIMETNVTKMMVEMLHQPMLMPSPSYLPAADAASLSTSLLPATDVASLSNSLLPATVLAASSVPASVTSLPSSVSVSTSESATSLLSSVLTASSEPASVTSLPSSVSTPISSAMLSAIDD